MMRFLAIAGAAALVSTPALAEVIDLTGSVNYGLDIAQTVLGFGITVVLGAIAAWARPFLGSRVVDAAASRIEKGAKRYIQANRVKYLSRTWTVEVENEFIASAVKYLNAQFPDAMREVGATPVGIKNFVATLIGEDIANLPSNERPVNYVGQNGLT